MVCCVWTVPSNRPPSIMQLPSATETACPSRSPSGSGRFGPTFMQVCLEDCAMAKPELASSTREAAIVNSRLQIFIISSPIFLRQLMAMPRRPDRGPPIATRVALLADVLRNPLYKYGDSSSLMFSLMGLHTSLESEL